MCSIRAFKVDFALQNIASAHFMRMKVKGPRICVSTSGQETVALLTILTAFAENLVLTAHPSKTGGDWWYGTVLRDGKSGFFPKTYVEPLQTGMSSQQ